MISIFIIYIFSSSFSPPPLPNLNNSFIHSFICNYSKDCPQGQYGEREASIASDNPTGNSDITCLPCVSGKVGLGAQLSQRGGGVDVGGCTDCPLGKWLAIPGQTTLESCVLCLGGKYADQTGLYMEPQCAFSFLFFSFYFIITLTLTNSSIIYHLSSLHLLYCLSQSTTTGKDCSSGKFQPNTGQDKTSDCKDCVVGKWNDVAAQTVCKNCRTGKYGVSTGYTLASQCDNCGLGKYLDATGQDEETDCKNCIAGQYGDQTGVKGLADSSESSEKCKKCPIGKYSIHVGLQSAAACTDCAIGKYSDQLGNNEATDCKACGLGRYTDQRGLTAGEGRYYSTR